MTTKMEWKDSYLCNDPIINKQHQLFIARVNRLYDLLVEAASEDILKNELDLILLEAAFHFETEEKFLERNNYPKLEEHIEEHKSLMNSLIDKVIEFQKVSKIIKISISVDIKLLLQVHFEKEDQQYRNELN